MIQLIRNLIPRNPRTLAALVVVLVLGILAACLWPFGSPKNTAAWVSGGQGIDLGPYGALLGSKPLNVPGDSQAVSASIELWLVPNPDYVFGSILTIYTPQNSRQFDIGQWHSGLAVRSTAPGDSFYTGGAPCYAPDVFVPGHAVFVTVTSDEHGTSVYVDGILRRATPDFYISNQKLAGRLVVGTAASSADTWRGQIRGLAVYASALDVNSVRSHYANWIKKGAPEVGVSDGLLALYRFDEHDGRTVHNAVMGGGNLSIPERFTVPEKDVLARPDLGNWPDIIENVIGFMPLGFVLCGYLLVSRRELMAFFLTAVVLSGFSLSLELLQTLLPTRDSSMMDVISNSSGGIIGALTYIAAIRILHLTAYQSSEK
jgi:hypothetical protein